MYWDNDENDCIATPSGVIVIMPRTSYETYQSMLVMIFVLTSNP